MSDECRAVVRAADKDIFLATLFAPEASQRDLFALHAFVAETERVPMLVSEAKIGEIRLQWWHDSLAGIEQGTPQQHPVAQALAACVAQQKLPLTALSALVEAHRFDLYADPLASMHDLEKYMGETRSTVFQLACMILDRDAAARCAEAAGLAGVALGIARAFQSPILHQKMVPTTATRAEVLDLAGKRLAEAKQAVLKLPQSVLPAFLPLSLCKLYLAAARRGDHNVPQWRRQWTLWRASRNGPSSA
jgi:phytoene synthase